MYETDDVVTDRYNFCGMLGYAVAVGETMDFSATVIRNFSDHVVISLNDKTFSYNCLGHSYWPFWKICKKYSITPSLSVFFDSHGVRDFSFIMSASERTFNLTTSSPIRLILKPRSGHRVTHDGCHFLIQDGRCIG